MGGLTQYPPARTSSSNRFVCTSATRPPSPFVGMEIYETDTRMTLVWEGAGWGPHWDRPWGLVGTATKTSTQTTTSTSTVDITDLSVTFTATAGRKYLITGSILIQSDTANDRASLVIRNGAGTQLQRRDPGTMSAANVPHTAVAEVIDTPGAGSVTYKLGFYRQGGSGTISAIGTSTIPAIISVYDVGPQTTLIGDQVYPANSNATNYQICTSSTRPSSPFPGMQIYETDTKNTLFYDATLGWTPPWNSAWGVVGYTALTTPFDTPVAAFIPGYTVSYSTVAGRRHLITATCPYRKTANAGHLEFRVRNLSGDVLVTSTVVGMGVDQTNVVNCSAIVNSPSGSTSLVTSVHPTNDGAYLDITAGRPATLTVLDVGPA